MADAPAKVDLHFIKSTNFRVVHVDGVYGGLSPHGYIHATLYSERPAVPKRSQLLVRPDGSVEKEVVVETIGGVVRELEADLVMNFTTALSLLYWLEPKVDALRQAIGINDENWESLRKTQRDMQLAAGG